MRLETKLTAPGYVWLTDECAKTWLDDNIDRLLSGRVFTDRKEAYRYFILRLIQELSDPQFARRVEKLIQRRTVPSPATTDQAIRVLSLYLKDPI